jgi:hypothetical protein
MVGSTSWRRRECSPPRRRSSSLTAFPDDANRGASIRLGATHFVEKPVALERLAELAAQAGGPDGVHARVDPPNVA